MVIPNDLALNKYQNIQEVYIERSSSSVWVIFITIAPVAPFINMV